MPNRAGVRKGKKMLEIQLPDGTVVEHSDDASPLSVAESIGSRLAKAVIAAKIGDQIVDAMRPLKAFAGKGPIPLKLLTDKDPESLGVLRHSCAHIMARRSCGSTRMYR